MKLVFVCAGNTCRSSMAEGLARSLWAERGPGKGGLEISSAGVAAWPDEPASPEAVAVLLHKGIDISAHRSRRLSKQIAERADLILTMTGAHKEAARTDYPEAAHKIFTLAEYAGLGAEEVRDPFGGDIRTYGECADKLAVLIAAALNKIAENAFNFPLR